MAISQSDGSIILSTKVDTTGVKAGMSSITGIVGKLGKLAAIVGVTLSLQKIVNFSREAGKLATQQEANVQRLIDIYGQASAAIGDYIDNNARALGMAKSAAASFAAVYGNLFSVWADQATNAELTKQYLNMTAVVASKTGRTVEDVQERVRSGLLGNTEAIEDLGVFVNIKTIEMTDAFKRMANGKSWEQLDAYTQQQIRTMAILEQATQKYGTEVADTTAIVRARYTAAFEDFKATWGQVVNKILIPILKIATLIFDMLTAGLRALAGFTGKTVEGFEQTSISTGKTAENIGEQVKGQKALNKELKKSLAGFDDLMILSDNLLSSASSDGTASGASLEIPKLDITNQGEKDAGKMQEIAEVIKSTLSDILKAASGALMAVGLILLFSGNVSGGIGLIGAAAAAFIAGDTLGSENPVEILKGHLETILKYLVPGLLGIGVLLLFLGVIPLGIGLILGGIAYWGYKEVRGKEYDETELKDKLNVIMEAVSLGIIAIGVLLLFFGHIPLGIGMIIAGKSLLSATEAKLDESKTPTAIKKFVDKNSALIVGISIALVVIALILFACGVVSPLSLGLLLAGGSALAATETIKPGAIKETISNFFQENAKLVIGVSAALIVLGVILLFTGVATPLAIGLLVAGGSALAATVAFNWNFIVDKVKEIWGNVTDFWNKHIAPIFTKEWWMNLAITAGNGILSGFEGAINGVITMFEKMINWIVSGLNKISFDVPDWVPGIGGKDFGFNISKVNFDRVTIPKLAQGSVIPANKEFLAILGDQKQGVNIEAPLQTIVDAFNIALSQNGGFASGNTTVVLEIDGREFGRAVVEQGEREYRRIGTRLVTT